MPGEALQLKRLIERYNLQRIPWVARILQSINVGLLSDTLARNLLPRVEQLVDAAIDHPNFLHRAPEYAELYPSNPPDVEIGHLVDKPHVRFGLQQSDQPRSILVAGNAGAGKTTLIRNTVVRSEALGASVIVFDRKQDYADLPDVCQSSWLRVSVYDALRIGLNAPEGVPPKAWVNIVASIFSARAGMVAAWTAFAALLWWLLGALNADRTYTPVARLWDLAGSVPSPEAQIAARKALEAAKMAEFEELRISRRNVLLIRILDLGWRFLGRTPPQAAARGGVGHAHIATWVARAAQNERSEAVLEWPVPGTSHIADVMRRLNGEQHVYEIIVTCTSNLKSHLKACFLESNAVATCTIVLLQKVIRDKVRAHLAADPEIAPLLDRVRFEIAQTYLDKEPWQ